MTDSKLLDSSIWIAFVIKKIHLSLIESNDKLYLSILSLFEIKNRLLKDKIPPQDIIKTIEFIKKRSIILPVTINIAEKAAELSANEQIPAIDSLIYTTSLFNNSQFITMDNDFRNLKDAIVLD